MASGPLAELPLVIWVAIVLVAATGSAALSAVIAWRRANSQLEEFGSISAAIAGRSATLKDLTHQYESAQEALKRTQRERAEAEKRTRELVELEARASEIRDLLETGDAQLKELFRSIEEKQAAHQQAAADLHDIQSEVDLYSRVADFTEYGIFEEPKYLHETSERYSVEIKRIRERQSEMIKAGKAVELPDGIQVDGSSKKGRAILDGQAKMLLRTFNIECDLLIEKLNPSNFDRTLERIEKNAETLEKLAVSLMCGLSPDYVQLKFEEAKLYYEYTLKKAREQEEQRQIREQMREEQKAIREYEKAIADADRQEKMVEGLLKKAKDQLAGAHEEAKAELAAKVAVLEQQLADAEAQMARAKSLAEQTRRGHVYVISNIGSFGDDIYKIGLTRRLDPMDRVKELGDASVPFEFDVHAIIFSEDAPAMETALHRKFNHRRVNAVNLRKEFFRVSLSEIKNAVSELSIEEADFRMTALAEEYFESLRLQGGDDVAA